MIDNFILALFFDRRLYQYSNEETFDDGHIYVDEAALALYKFYYIAYIFSHTHHHNAPLKSIDTIYTIIDDNYFQYWWITPLIFANYCSRQSQNTFSRFQLRIPRLYYGIDCI